MKGTVYLRTHCTVASTCGWMYQMTDYFSMLLLEILTRMFFEGGDNKKLYLHVCQGQEFSHW